MTYVLGSSLGKERKGRDGSLNSNFITPVGMKSFGFLNDSITSVLWCRHFESVDETALWQHSELVPSSSWRFLLFVGINTLVGYDLVPEPKIIDAALRACRRLNDFASAVRILEVVKVSGTAAQSRTAAFALLRDRQCKRLLFLDLP